MEIYELVRYILNGTPIEGREEEIQKSKRISNFMLNYWMSMERSIIIPLNKLIPYSSVLEKVEYSKLLARCFGNPRKKSWRHFFKEFVEYRCKKCGKFFSGDKFTLIGKEVSIKRNFKEAGKKWKCPSCGGHLIDIPVKEILEWISKYFNCSIQEAKIYRKILNENQITEILRKFGQPTDSLVKKISGMEKEDKRKKRVSLRDFKK